jgi:His/Glu/Gln/Arg/opine family amino acid ABC transporter permease subunit
VTHLVAYTFRWSIVHDSVRPLFHGLKITLELAGMSLAASLVVGLLVAVARMSTFRPLRWFAYVYIQFFRALSLYIYVLWLYFGLATVGGINFSPLTAGVIALTMLNSAYMAEIYRSAIGGVDPGQREAATSLGYGRVQTFGWVVMPQAIRIAVPALVNQFVDIVKDSSIVSLIGTTDLMGITNQLSSSYRAPFEVYTLVAFYYLTLVILISAAAAALERRLGRHVAR